MSSLRSVSDEGPWRGDDEAKHGHVETDDGEVGDVVCDARLPLLETTRLTPTLTAAASLTHVDERERGG